jgi:High potential iron-sulfur protein
MKERQICESRRKVLRAAVGGVSSVLVLRRPPAQAADKMTKAQAEYQDTPNGIYSCATCTLFEAPNGCKVVEGEVSKEGWCKAFAMAD